MKTKILLWILALILLASFVMAEPPFIVGEDGSFSEGLVIEHPEVIAISVDDDYAFDFHVFNSTTGYPIVEGLSCYFYLFGRHGEHLYNTISTEIEQGELFYDYEFNVDGGNFSEVGLLYYIAACNSSDVGGFTAHNFAVTPDGRIIVEAQGTIYATVIFVAVMLLLITLFFAWSINGENEFTVGGDFVKVNFNKYVKIFLWFMSYQLLLFLSFMVLKTAERFLFFDFITVMFDWLFIILLVGELPLVILIVYFLVLKALFDMKIHEWDKRGLKPR